MDKSHIWGDFYYSEGTQFLRVTETSGNRQGVGKPLEQKQREIVEPTETFKFTYWPLGIFSLWIGFICQSIECNIISDAPWYLVHLLSDFVEEDSYIDTI